MQKLTTNAVQRDNIPLHLEELSVEYYLVDIDLDQLVYVEGILLALSKSGFIAFKDNDTIETFDTQIYHLGEIHSKF